MKKFPEVLGLEASELADGQKTAPSYLKRETAYNKAIRSNPQLLGKNYDCLAEHETWRCFFFLLRYVDMSRYAAIIVLDLEV